MITYVLLYFIYGAILLATAPLRLLGNAELPAEIYTTLSNVGGYLGAMEVIFPVGTLLAILGIYLTIEGFILTYKTIMWVIRRFPTQS